MTKPVDQTFLNAVERAGWRITFADLESVNAMCPREGCTMSAKLQPGKRIPETCGPITSKHQVQMTGFFQARQVLLETRQMLCLSITETEDAAGLTDDHIAKVEKYEIDRVPNVDTFIYWANALGWKVMLVRGDLPPRTKRILADTRAKVRDRLQKYAHWNRLRDGKKGGRAS